MQCLGRLRSAHELPESTLLGHSITHLVEPGKGEERTSERRLIGVRAFSAALEARLAIAAYNRLGAEAPMTNVTVELSDREIEALKARTGKRSAAAALKAWAARANAKRSAAELRAALQDSLKEESADRGRRFDSGREAIRWLES